jgi:hypothetical protein
MVFMCERGRLSIGASVFGTQWRWPVAGRCVADEGETAIPACEEKIENGVDEQGASGPSRIGAEQSPLPLSCV